MVERVFEEVVEVETSSICVDTCSQTTVEKTAEDRGIEDRRVKDRGGALKITDTVISEDEG